MDWTGISALATGGGTLVLAGATFASVRSANRVARVAERSLLVGLRPLLVPSRLDDAPQKVHFVDGKYVATPGGGGAAETADDGSALYLALSVRNAGTGIAVLHGWHFYPGRFRGDHAPLDEFVRLTRDIYVPAGDIGFWQGAFRDPAAPEFAAARDAIADRSEITVDVLYGDLEGGQRVVTRFLLLPRQDEGWSTAVSRYWNIDGTDPR